LNNSIPRFSVSRQPDEVSDRDRGSPEENRVAVIEEWISSPLPSKEKDSDELNNELGQGNLDTKDGRAASPPNRGRLSQVHQNYAFIDTGGGRFFFHRGKWAGRLDFVSLKDGSIVEFDIGQAEAGKGPTALNVRPIDDLPVQLDQQTPVKGAIKSLTNSYGFIKLDSGSDLFFHRTNCTATTSFRALTVGDRVRCVVGRHDDGRLFGLNVECYSGLN
jgi:LuxR family glucitol operon transcriptional activator